MFVFCIDVDESLVHCRHGAFAVEPVRQLPSLPARASVLSAPCVEGSMFAAFLIMLSRA